ncbi:MAG: T9SS type A sorting domain-containing protein [Bacteroidetes bacterium]|nr:T9SS type A sorting domain-containing protein [Bacteroidota bacterium]
MKKLFTTCFLSLTLSSAFAQVESSSSVLAYPNPARYDVSFSYNTSGAAGSVSIIVTDMIGQKIAELPAKDKQGMITWNTNSVPNGIYIYKLKDSSKTLAIGRLTIAK